MYFYGIYAKCRAVKTLRTFLDTVNDGGDHMANEGNTKGTKTDGFALILDNLRKALYTKTGNPYTGDGSIFYFDESKLAGDYKTKFFQKREMGTDAFNLLPEQQKIMMAYRMSPGRSDSKIQINQTLFWTVHLAGWKRHNASPVEEQIHRLFTDSKGRTLLYRSEFKKDLENTKFTLNEEGSVFLTPASSCIPGAGQSEVPVSEYIVECNYLIVKNYTGGRKALLRKVIGDFAQNIHDAERSRNDDGKFSMLPDNEAEVKELCSCLNRMMRAYDQLPEYEIDKKDWLLGRSLAWLVIGAMLRNCLSMDLINSSLVPFLPPADGDLLSVPRLHIQDDDEFIIENFHPNEDTVYGRASQVQRISEFFGEQETGVGKSRIVYIQGIGGIGKSTLAKAFTEQFREKYNTVIEVSASGAKEAVMLMSASVPETIQYPVRLQRIRTYCIKKKMLLIVHDYNQPEDETYGDWGKLGCDIILTGWFDRGMMGLRTLRLTTNDGSDQDALSAAVEIFRSNYLKNAEMANDNELKANLEQVLDEQENSVQELCAMAGCHPLTIKVGSRWQLIHLVVFQIHNHIIRNIEVLLVTHVAVTQQTTTHQCIDIGRIAERAHLSDSQMVGDITVVQPARSTFHTDAEKGRLNLCDTEGVGDILQHRPCLLHESIVQLGTLRQFHNSLDGTQEGWFLHFLLILFSDCCRFLFHSVHYLLP